MPHCRIWLSAPSSRSQDPVSFNSTALEVYQLMTIGLNRLNGLQGSSGRIIAPHQVLAAAICCAFALTLASRSRFSCDSCDINSAACVQPCIVPPA